MNIVRIWGEGRESHGVRDRERRICIYIYIYGERERLISLTSAYLAIWVEID